MICDGQKIERAVQLDLVTAVGDYFLALCIAICVIGCCPNGRYEGVKGLSGMDVQVAE